eukprot:8499186-Karenia_brevis.AAC.1
MRIQRQDLGILCMQCVTGEKGCGHTSSSDLLFSKICYFPDVLLAKIRCKDVEHSHDGTNMCLGVRPWNLMTRK